MRIVILGGNGQIGKHLFQKFSKDGNYETFAVCRSKEASFLIRHISDNIIIGSIEDPSFCDSALSTFDIIINSAVAGGNVFGLSNDNKVICNNLAKIAAVNPDKIIIHFSSLMIYRSLLKVEEKYFRKPNPDSFYGHTKEITEKIFLNTNLSNGSRIYILRLGHVYGPSLMQSKVSIDYILNKLKLPFNGSKFSNCLHIDYFYHSLITLIDNNLDGGVYNSVNFPNNTWREIADWHSAACNLPTMDNASNLTNTNIDTIINNHKPVGLIFKIIRALKNVIFQLPLLMRQYLGDASGYFLSKISKKSFEKIKRIYVNYNFKQSIFKKYAVSNDLLFLSTESVPGRILTADNFESGNLNEEKYLLEMRNWYLESQNTK